MVGQERSLTPSGNRDNGGLMREDTTEQRPRAWSGRIFHVTMLLVILAGVVVAYFTTQGYGESWDEAINSAYGLVSLKAYGGSTEYLSYGKKVYYGPFYVMIWRGASSVLKVIHKGWTSIDGAHFANYLTFSLGVGALYFICLKFVRPKVALGMSLLFASQPLLHGYAFINPKDIPFMTILTIAVAAGIFAVDRHVVQSTSGRLVSRERWRLVLQSAFSSDLEGLRSLAKAHPGRALCSGLSLGLVISLLIGYPYQGWIEALVRDAYFGRSLPVVNGLFDQIAQARNTLPVDAYVAKASILFAEARAVLGMVLAGGLVVGLKRLFPASLRGMDRTWLAGQAWIAIAGIMTGLATSVRVAGPMAGGLVSLYALMKAGRRSIGSLVLYWGAAALATYASWPFLWGAPLRHLLESFDVMSSFSAHTVLFKGAYIQSDMLPWDYLPHLVTLELTLPILVLFLWGSLVLVRRLAAGLQESALAMIPILWIAIPMLAFVVLRTPIYGNIRQVLFGLPPLFLLAAIGLEDVWRRIRREVLGWGLLCLALVPSVVGIVSLYPYEYIYFNALAGGVRGAEGTYELDHWCTSYREAMLHVDQVAPKGSTVGVWGPIAAAADFARPDLIIVSDDGTQDVQYALGCKRVLDYLPFHPGFDVVYQVKRDSAVLAVVKEAPIDSVSALGD